MPWDGFDPRSLTKVALALSLASEGTGRVNLDAPLVAQLELFPEEKPYGS